MITWLLDGWITWLVDGCEIWLLDGMLALSRVHKIINQPLEMRWYAWGLTLLCHSTLKLIQCWMDSRVFCIGSDGGGGDGFANCWLTKGSEEWSIVCCGANWAMTFVSSSCWVVTKYPVPRRGNKNKKIKKNRRVWAYRSRWGYWPLPRVHHLTGRTSLSWWD